MKRDKKLELITKVLPSIVLFSRIIYIYVVLCIFNNGNSLLAFVMDLESKYDKINFMRNLPTFYAKSPARKAIEVWARF